MTDVLLAKNGKKKFSWGETRLDLANPTRKKYICALQSADKHDYSKLEAFIDLDHEVTVMILPPHKPSMFPARIFAKKIILHARILLDDKRNSIAYLRSFVA
jgi:hypothetical protein